MSKFDSQILESQGFRVTPCEFSGVKCFLVVGDLGTQWTKENLIYRSSIWTEDGEPVSLGLRKFFNFTEKPHVVPDPSDIINARILEKLDGCLDENTKIETEKDGIISIKQLCETKYNGKVLAFDHNTNTKVWTPVLGHSILENNDDWYELTLENGNKINLTGNHRVFLPKLNCYRRVDELLGDEEITLKN